MPLVWVHFQANHDELSDMLYKSIRNIDAFDCFQCAGGGGGDVSLEGMIKPSTANSVYLQTLARASRATQDQVLALCRR